MNDKDGSDPIGYKSFKEQYISCNLEDRYKMDDRELWAQWNCGCLKIDNGTNIAIAVLDLGVPDVSCMAQKLYPSANGY